MVYQITMTAAAMLFMLVGRVEGLFDKQNNVVEREGGGRHFRRSGVLRWNGLPGRYWCTVDPSRLSGTHCAAVLGLNWD